MNDLETAIRKILVDYARLSVDAADPNVLGDHTDLYSVGLTSHASVTVMLGCEDAFDVEFPAHLLTKSTFGTVGALRAALTELDVTVTGAA